MKKEQKILGVKISPELIKKLEEVNYNKSKLVDSLLTNYFKKQDEIILNKKS